MQIKEWDTTIDELKTKGARYLGRSRKYDGACYMYSTLWALPSGACVHHIQYREIPGASNQRVLPSSKRVAPFKTTKEN